MKIAVFGGIYIDIISHLASIPAPGETVIADHVEVSLGGKASNAAVAIARQGSSVSMVGEVGTDPLGQKALDAFKLENIDTTLIARRPQAVTDTVQVLIADGGQTSVIAAENINLSIRRKVTEGFFKAYDTGNSTVDGIYTTLEVLPSLDFILAEAFNRSIPVMCDGGPRTRTIDPSLLRYITIFSPNAYEAQVLTGIRITNMKAAETAARKIHEYGVQWVVITLGEKGVFLLGPDGGGASIPAIEVSVVNEIGAGDAFRAVFFLEYLTHHAPLKAAQKAIFAGAYLVGHKGSNSAMPTKEELERFMRGVV